MPNEFIGEYKTQRDGGLLYSYAATWIRRFKDVAWRAKVRQNGKPVGELVGRIVNAPSDTEVSALVQTQIEADIESKVV